MTPALQKAKKAALILTGLTLAALAFVWLALPSILQAQAEKFISEKTGHRLTLAKPEINPLVLSVRLRELRLTDPAGAELLAFRELFVDVSAASLKERAVVFDTIALDGLNASLIHQKDGSLNWMPLLEALKSNEPATPDQPLPRLDIHHLVIKGAQIALADERPATPFATRIEPLDIELEEVSTLPDDKGRFSLTANTAFGAQLNWQGDVSLNPIASSGSVVLSDIDLARLAPLLEGMLPVQPPAGVAALSTDYRFSLGGGQLAVVLEKITAGIKNLVVQPHAGDNTPRLAVDAVELKEGRFDLGSRQLALGAITLQGSRLEATIGKKPRAAVISVSELALADAKVDLAQRNATLGSVLLKGGRTAIRRDAEGKIDLLAVMDSLSPKPIAAPAKVATSNAAAEPAAPWRFGIERIGVSGFGIDLHDESLPQAVDLALDNIAIDLSGISDKLKAALPLKASLDVRSGGRLEVSGKVTPADAAAELQLKLAGLAIKPVQPYVSRAAALDLVGGRLNAEGRVLHTAKGSSYRGNFALQDLRLNEAGTPNVFLAWKSLATKELEVSPSRLGISLLSLDGLNGKLIIDKDKSTNLKRVMRTQSDAAQVSTPSGAVATGDRPAVEKVGAGDTLKQVPLGDAPPSSSAPAAQPDAPEFLINIDRLRFRNGEMYFADNSLLLPFGTRIHGLRGSINGLSSKPGVPGQLELDGEVDEFGLARAVGQVDLFNPTDFMDLKVVFRNVDMAHMSPYSATFAGRRINSGKLSLELDYKIKQRQLAGDNRIILDRLELGDRVESPTAKDLPLDLAIAILRDSDGRIDLGLPISGSLDDPQFSYGSIIWKAITNVLGKIVTAPFRALGALFGGGENLDQIAFEAGATRLTPPEREKLGRIATVLNKRPGLALTVTGTWAEADRLARQDLQLRRTVAGLSGQAAAEKADGKTDNQSQGGADPGPLSTRTPKVQEALESLFADRFGSAELASLKAGFRSANPGQMEENMGGKMLSRLTSLIRKQRELDAGEIGQLKGADFHGVLFERLRAKETVTDEAMQMLATKRAEHTLEALKAAGAPAKRIRAVNSEKVEAEGREISLKLGLDKAGS